MVFCFVTVYAQDGIFGSFQLGQKIVDMKSLNDTLTSHGIEVTFPNSFWSIGGEGHVLVAKNFVLGGKAFVIGTEKVEPVPEPGHEARRVKISAGLGEGYLGYAFIGGESGIRLIPEVGLGVSPFLFQTKEGLGNDSTFGSMIDNTEDNMVVLEKVGFMLDFCLAMDWYMKFIHLLSIIPGLETGPLLHAEAGYCMVPVKTRWFRDNNELKQNYYPDLKINGFYFNVGIGLGITSSSMK